VRQTPATHAPRPREQGEQLGALEFIGESQAHEVLPGQRVLDIGDIVLEPYERPKVE